MNMKPQQKEKFSAKVWLLKSPESKYHGTLTRDTVVSLAWMETHFKGGWTIKPLFPKEQQTAQKKADRVKGKE